MYINKTTFFAYARRSPFGGRLSQGQVDGCNALFDSWQRHAETTDLRHMANILAQVFHETGGTMQPVRETFAKTDAQAISRLESAWKKGKLKQVSLPYWREGYFGRGPIQITHLENYIKLGNRLGIDLANNPSLALDLKHGSDIAVIGMLEGLFSGKKLSDYFNGSKDDSIGARRIVNGADKAKLIAGYHKSFLDALKAAESTTPQPTDVVKDDARPDDVAPTESKSVLAIATSGAGALATSVIAAVNNPWALGAVFGIIVAGGVLFWLFKTGRLEQKKESAV